MEAYIAGTISHSITNWPGKTSFVVLFAGCNFNCPYCFSLGYMEQKEEFKVGLRDMKNEIVENKNFVDAVVFSGGEPCLQRPALMYLALHSKIANLKTAIETNGSNPEVIKVLIEKELVDLICLDLKAPFKKDLFENVTKSKTFFKETDEVISDIKNTLEILKNNQDKVDVEFRTTIVPGLVYRKEDMLDIAKEISGLKCKWRIQRFRSDKGVNAKFKNVNSPTKEFLVDLKKACQRDYPNLKIEVEL